MYVHAAAVQFCYCMVAVCAYVCVCGWGVLVQTPQPTQVRAAQDDVEIETRSEQSDAFAVRCNTSYYLYNLYN